MHNKYVALTGIIGCLFIFAMGGCGSDTDEPSDGPVNELPLVRSLTIPEEFAPGETLELQIRAHDPDGDILSYTWHVSAGKLDATTGSTVKWTAPSDTLAVTITVHVHDGPDSSITRSRTVTYLAERPPEVPKLIPNLRVYTALAAFMKCENPVSLAIAA